MLQFDCLIVADERCATAMFQPDADQLHPGLTTLRNACCGAAAHMPMQIFFSVYEMAIDTVLLSFCEDCESNNGHPRCAPPLLLEAIGELKPAAGAGGAAPVAVGYPADQHAVPQHQGKGRQWT